MIVKAISFCLINQYLKFHNQQEQGGYEIKIGSTAINTLPILVTQTSHKWYVPAHKLYIVKFINQFSAIQLISFDATVSQLKGQCNQSLVPQFIFDCHIFQHDIVTKLLGKHTQISSLVVNVKFYGVYPRQIAKLFVVIYTFVFVKNYFDFKQAYYRVDCSTRDNFRADKKFAAAEGQSEGLFDLQYWLEPNDKKNIRENINIIDFNF